MYIEEVIIDGFKSYSCRTVISGFDPHFNAITGLNGSGKSNILDAICFVLGISNLGQVRVNKLQQLVYKQGQTGVTRASVSIVFNNENREQSPVGYEAFERITVTRQVVVGGKNKYLINGRAVQAQQVQNLFHSVQLNINNPHFLIMQGRITKVLNMKPVETLGMIEEAAGTRMFEEKKLAALETIEKKDQKLSEIERIIREEIQPTLSRLEKERETYLAFVNNKNERERLERFVAAYHYSEALRRLQAAGEDIENEVSELERLVNELTQSREGVERDLAQKERAASEASKKDSTRAEKAVAQASKDLVKAESHLRSLRDALASDKGKLDGYAQQLQESEAGIVDLVRAIETQKANVASRLEQRTAQENAYQACQRALQANNASLALNAEETGGKTLADQVMDLERSLAMLASEKKGLAMKLEALRKSHKQRRSAAQKGADSAHKKLVADLKSAREKLAATEKEFPDAATASDTPKDDGEALRKQRKEMQALELTLAQQVERAKAQVAGLRFEFDDPSPGFDRSRVKGMVVQLAKMRDSRTATALNVTAGGKLFNVVVDNEQTGKQLLTNGRLRKRVTILPLNKIQGKALTDDQKREIAKHSGPDGTGARLAIDLVAYDDELQAAMEHVFGGTVICDDKRTALEMTKNPRIRCQAVTLDGDVYETSGALSGGSRSASANVLQLLEDMNRLSSELDSIREQIKSLDEQIAAVESAMGQVEEGLGHLEQARHTVAMLQQRLEASSFYELEREVQELESQLEETEKAASTNEHRQSEDQARLDRLRQQMSAKTTSDGKDSSKMKAVEKQMAAAKKAMDSAISAHKESCHELEKLNLELDAAKQELEALRESLPSLRTAASASESAVQAQEKEVESTRDRYNRAKEEASAVASAAAEARRAVEVLESEKEALNKRAVDAQVQLKQRRLQAAAAKQERARSQKIVSDMEKSHPWIQSEKHLFGRPGSLFDFSARNPARSQRELEALDAQQEQLKNRLNAKVMNMYEKAEEEFHELLEKRQQLTRDRKTLMDVIEDLEAKKKVALQETWRKVNGDFGSIFSTLLGGASAALQPVDGQSVLEGLEVKVSFAGVYKNLTELSGGQRSLLALSLILALLLYKPAPMYILDEVDAALDLSHTENIGKMLRKHFSQSQFIVVSLKEGMWKNANVVFRAKFVDGTSTVERIGAVPLPNVRTSPVTKRLRTAQSSQNLSPNQSQS